LDVIRKKLGRDHVLLTRPHQDRQEKGRHAKEPITARALGAPSDWSSSTKKKQSLLTYNDLEGLKKLFEKPSREIAAIIRTP
jgi:glutamate-1-semialdehyde aminotransferase